VYKNSTNFAAAHTTDAGGSYSVDSNDTNTYTEQIIGNTLAGSYTKTTTATDIYNTTETSSASASDYFTLHETGTNASTTTETGSTLDGDYTSSQQGTDSYSITDTGAHPAGGFSETLTGTDTYTLSESGNTPDQTFTRDLTGSGSYTLVDSGAGATLTSGSGSYTYGMTETGDDRSGELSQSVTGTDRYNLLEGFNNVSNSQASNGPGHLNFSPVGVPFTDPPAEDDQAKILELDEQIKKQTEVVEAKARAYLRGTPGVPDGIAIRDLQLAMGKRDKLRSQRRAILERLSPDAAKLETLQEKKKLLEMKAENLDEEIRALSHKMATVTGAGVVSGGVAAIPEVGLVAVPFVVLFGGTVALQMHVQALLQDDLAGVNKEIKKLDEEISDLKDKIQSKQK
jgi:hypothetical protein